MNRRAARIAVRVDGGTLLGSGHVMRCLCVAQELERRGAQLRFLCREVAGHLCGHIERQGYPVERLRDAEAATTRDALQRFQAQWLIVDHYDIGAEWELEVRIRGLRILVIDDMANRHHACEVLLDQNFFGAATSSRYDSLLEPSCRRLLGPRYALLQREYAPLRALLPARNVDARRVLVFFGGTDASNETAKTLRALSAAPLQHLAVDVVLGSNHPAAEEIESLVRQRAGTCLYRNLPSLAGLMFRADVCIGAGGATTSERLCLMLPTVVVTVALNQEGPIENLAREGAVVWAGRAEAIDEAALATVILATVRRSPAVPPLVDGYGASRAAAAILPPAPSGLALRRASLADARLLFEWRNDPSARAMSRDDKPLAWDAHLRWLEGKLADPNAHIYVGHHDALPVGHVRWDTVDDAMVLSYAVDPELRGLGFGRALVELAQKSLRRRPLGGIRAYVRLHNHYSRRVFLGLGWHETIGDDGYVYSRNVAELNEALES